MNLEGVEREGTGECMEGGGGVEGGGGRGWGTGKNNPTTRIKGNRGRRKRLQKEKRGGKAVNINKQTDSCQKNPTHAHKARQSKLLNSDNDHEETWEEARVGEGLGGTGGREGEGKGTGHKEEQEEGQAASRLAPSLPASMKMETEIRFHCSAAGPASARYSPRAISLVVTPIMPRLGSYKCHD